MGNTAKKNNNKFKLKSYNLIFSLPNYRKSDLIFLGDSDMYFRWPPFSLLCGRAFHFNICSVRQWNRLNNSYNGSELTQYWFYFRLFGCCRSLFNLVIPLSKSAISGNDNHFWWTLAIAFISDAIVKKRIKTTGNSNKTSITTN